MRKTIVNNDHSIVENVDFDRLKEILKDINKAELSRRCGYYSEYIVKNVLRKKRLNWTVAHKLEDVYGISPDEYTYKKPEKSTSNDGQLALRLDKDLIARFRNWAFYNQLSQKDAMEKILSEYLDGKKTATTASSDDTTEITASDDDIYKYWFSFNGEFLKRLAVASMNEHISISDFIFKCLVEGVGDKILDDEKAERKN